MKRTLFAITAIATVILALGAYAQVRSDQPGPQLDVEPGNSLEQGLPEAQDQACTVQPAQANDDFWTTTKNTPVTRSPLENDPDTPQQNLAGFGQPSNGTAEEAGIDAIKYTPDTGFVGSDSFNYTHKGCLQCFNGWCSEPDFDVGTVHIDVTN